MYWRNRQPMRYRAQRHVRAEMIEWLRKEEFEYFITFIINGKMSVSSVHRKVRAWLARVDRYLLGRNWARTVRDDRTFLVGFIENPDQNIHMHAMVRLAMSNKILPIWRAKRYWRDLVKSGDLDMQRIKDQTAVAFYITKKFTEPTLEDGYFVS